MFSVTNGESTKAKTTENNQSTTSFSTVSQASGTRAATWKSLAGPRMPESGARDEVVRLLNGDCDAHPRHPLNLGVEGPPGDALAVRPQEIQIGT